MLRSRQPRQRQFDIRHVNWYSIARQTVEGAALVLISTVLFMAILWLGLDAWPWIEHSIQYGWELMRNDS